MNLIRREMRELYIYSIVILFIGMVSLSISCYIVSTNTSICFPIEIWIEGCPVVDFFLPLLVSIPFSITLYMKRINGFINYAAVRMNRTKYIICQILSGVIICAITTFLIYFATLILSLFVFFEGSSSSREYIYDYVFGVYQAEVPILFGIAWCAWKGVVASLFTCFGYLLALYVDNLFVVSILPFIYVMAENLITGILGIPENGIMTSYVLNRLSPKVMKVENYFIGVVSYILFTAIIIFVLKFARGKQYEEDCSY